MLLYGAVACPMAAGVASRLASAGAVASIVTLGTNAFASSPYPEIVADELNMGCVPSCTICHIDNTGGFGSARKDFGLAIQAVGLEANEEDELAGYLRMLEDAASDVDGDGTPDIEELRAASDPNIPGDKSVCGQGPRYGCGARIAEHPTDAGGAASASMLAAILLLASRRRKANPRR